MLANRHAARPGQSLVEFAVIALVLALLLAVTVEMGRALFGAQTIQAAADLAAREISRTPLAVTYTSLYGSGGGDATAALNDPTVRQRIFDERLLVIDLDQNPAFARSDGTVDPVYQSFPVVNLQMFPLMIFDPLSIPGRKLLRYPGALLKPGDESAIAAIPVPTGFTDSGLRVTIPVVDYSGGGQAVTWVSVMEEINPGQFSIASTTSTPGMVGVRLNYPFQAAALSGYREGPGGPFEPGTPIRASDGGVKETNTIPGGGKLTVGADPDPGHDKGLQPYGGEFGLGFQLEQIPGSPGVKDRVRPFTRLVSGQSIYRRELFTTPTPP